ncbi:MAG: helix-turn-helix transcriptional regulator [Crocinitomicaceae bacterium]|nr:helix-turn-helix transcriptional regulator [Crocinitomicaceae bacterium]
MIPSHSLANSGTSKVVINRLSKLNDYDFSEPHRHDYYELFFFQNGGGEHEIDFKPFHIESASFQLVVPGQVHQMKRAPGSSGFVFLFSHEDIVESKSVFEFLLEQRAYSVDESEPHCTFPQEEADLIDSIISDAWKNKESISQPILKHTLIGLCLRMMERKPETNSSGSSDYTKFRQLLINNFTEIRSVSAYADELNMTPKALNEIVKKLSGATASDHIYKQVILEAKRLLLLGSSVKEVGFNLHFDDPAHFSKFFKKRVGISPAEFQKVHS